MLVFNLQMKMKLPKEHSHGLFCFYQESPLQCFKQWHLQLYEDCFTVFYDEMGLIIRNTYFIFSQSVSKFLPLVWVIIIVMK